MFSGDIIWRGLVYTVLMLFAKLVTGVWLIRFHMSWPKIRIPKSVRSVVTLPVSCLGWMYGGREKEAKKTESHEMGSQTKKKTTEAQTAEQSTPSTSPPKIQKPLSLYPAAILGTAMTARGEIGFLIASLAETTGLFASSGSEASSGSSEIYLVVTWAILLCTIIGPLSVGTLVKRVRRLQSGEESNLGVNGPLGIWGVG